MLIVVDAVGAPPEAPGAASPLRPVVEGAWRAASAQGHQLLFVGPEESLRAELRAASVEGGLVSILDAPAALDPGEDPVAACREHPESSAMRAAERAAAQKGSALVSVGGPRAAVAAGLWHLKRLRGVLKPVLAASLPTPKGTTLVLDAGANSDCKPWHLLQFALMGSLYAKRVLKIAEPTVGLLAPAAETCGENELLKETVPLLKYAGIKFAGKLRGDRLAAGDADVAVCDGPTGDLCLRTAEGLTEACFEILQSELASGGFLRRMGTRLGEGLRTAASVQERFSLAGAQPVLGLGGAMVVCRRPRTAQAVAGAVRAAVAMAESDFAERVQERLEDIKSDMEFARALE